MLNIIECERDGKRSIRSFILLSQKSDVDAYMRLLIQHKDYLQEELSTAVKQEERLRQMEAMVRSITASSSVQ